MIRKQLAQIININGQEIEGPLIGPGGQPIEKLSQVIDIVLQIIYPLAGIILFLYIMWAGYTYLTSHGEEEKLKSAQARISSAIIGFVLLTLSYLIVRILTYIIGFGESIL